MMISRLTILFVILFFIFSSTSPACSSPCPPSITGLLFSPPSPSSSSARLLLHSTRIPSSNLVAPVIEHPSGSCSPSRLESRSRHLRPLLSPHTQPSALDYGAPNADDVDCASPWRKYKISQAASVVGRCAWLLLLLYLLGTTASDYFSCAVEELSIVLKLSPAVAGVTLLAFGTGAPDVFSSAAAFLSSDSSSSIGFSSALGGALFVTTVVTGTVSLVTGEACVRINRYCFLRDAMFLLVSLGILTAIAIDGKVHLWEAILFLCIYAVYALAVSVPALVQACKRNCLSPESAIDDPLLQKVGNNGCVRQRSAALHPVHQHGMLPCGLEKEENPAASRFKHYLFLLYKYGIEVPLALPRRLTIPIVEEERWYRPVAVASSAIAPIFLAAVWLFEYSDSDTSFWIAAGMSGSLAVILGLLAFFSTENARPPQRFLWVWLVGSFVMSIVWFYITATEVVETVLSLGSSFQMNTNILGITVLAWSNSIGDLVADLTLACRGTEGAQIAISGCYAGPLFITVFGLGISLVTACCKSKSTTLILRDDASLFYISGFLAAGLIWALLMLPLRGMRLSRTFGAGLVLIYSIFLVVALCYAMGWISQ